MDAVGRWRFGAQRALFLEAGAGMQNTTGSSFPADGTHFNFTLLLSAGLAIPLTERKALLTGLRLFHISNANLLPNNSGYDGLQWFMGLSWAGTARQ